MQSANTATTERNETKANNLTNTPLSATFAGSIPSTVSFNDTDNTTNAPLSAAFAGPIFSTVSFNDTEFNSKAFAGMKNDGGFILEDVKGLDEISSDFFKQYGNFLNLSAEDKKPFEGTGNLNDLPGYYNYGRFTAGGRLSHRFMTVIENGKSKRELPFIENKTDLRSAADKYNTCLGTVVSKVTDSLDHGFKPKGLTDVFKKAFDGYNVLTNIDHYLPMTQEKLRFWLENKKITKSPNGMYEMFPNHKDLVPFSILLYSGNDCKGLYMEDPRTKTFREVSLKGGKSDTTKMLILVGMAMENLTNGELQARTHFVSLEPLQKGFIFSRNVIGSFFSQRGTGMLNCITCKAHEKPKFEPQPISTFFGDQAKILELKQLERVEKSIDDEFINPHPIESQITEIQTPDSKGMPIAYFRKN